MRDVASNAVYVHCYAHRLNLVLVDVCKTVPAARDFFHCLNEFTFSRLVH